MPRTLPWLTGASTTKSKAKASKSTSVVRSAFGPIKKRHTLPSACASDEDGISASPLPTTPKRRANRSPSTSPLPSPPKQEFMLPTDLPYRMVEDEFDSIAHTFTAHLHRAEYKRLSRLAAARSPTTIRSIIRPVDGRTTPPPQSLLKRKRLAQQNKTSSALEKSGAIGTGRNWSGSESESGNEEEKKFKRHEREVEKNMRREKEAEDNQWKGTELEGLMNLSSEREKGKGISLVGLETGKGDTKAQRGLGPGRGMGSKEGVRTGGEGRQGTLAGIGGSARGTTSSTKRNGKGNSIAITRPRLGLIADFDDDSNRNDIDDFLKEKDTLKPPPDHRRHCQRQESTNINKNIKEEPISPSHARHRPSSSSTIKITTSSSNKLNPSTSQPTNPRSTQPTTSTSIQPSKSARSKLSSLFDAFDATDSGSSSDNNNSNSRTTSSSKTAKRAQDESKRMSKDSCGASSTKSTTLSGRKVLNENETQVEVKREGEEDEKADGYADGYGYKGWASQKERRTADEIPLFLAV